MVNVRELQAKFIAQASGFRSTIQSMKKDVDSLATHSKRATAGMGKGFSSGAQGLQGRINNVSNSMKDFGSGLNVISDKVGAVGMSLTKKITLPAGLAIGAIGGMVAKMGWDRLKSVDVARSQLEGLGYSSREVGEITEITTDAIQGGMTTMGEGISIAAGGLAAGVEKGKDLGKYIELVGDSAVGAQRPVGEMAQIFNRIVGGGRLMTQELNMIEHGMPGFAKAMAKHYGVSVEAFREMVTAGEVSSDDFLIVMEDFAGGMAGAYSKTWPGMVQNTKAYIAILGEQLMSGVFEKSKESIAEFIDLLSSPKVVEGARKMGVGLGNAFGKIIQIVKSLLKWFVNLSTTTQKVIGVIAGLSVVIGPILVALAGVGKAVAFLSTGLGTLAGFFAKLLTPIKSLTTGTGLASKAFTFLGGTAGAVIGWVTLLAGALYMAYQKSEPFRNSITTLGNSIKNLWSKLKEVVKPLGVVKGEFGFLKTVALFLYGGLKDLAHVFFVILGGALAFIVNKVAFVIDIFVAMLSSAKHFTKGLKQLFTGDIRGAIDSFVKGFKTMASNIGKVFSDMLSKVWGYIKSITPKWLSSFINATKNILKNIGSFAIELPGKLKTGIVNGTKAIVSNLAKWSKAFGKWFVDTSKDIWEWAKSLPGKIKEGLSTAKDVFGDWFNTQKKNITKKAGEIKDDLITFAKDIPNMVKNGLGSGKSVFSKWLGDQHEENKKFYGGLGAKAMKWLKDKASSIGEGLKSWGDRFQKFFSALPGDIKKKAIDMWNSFQSNFLDKKDSIAKKLSEWGTSIGKFFADMPKKIKDKAIDMWNGFKSNFLDKKSSITEGLAGWKDNIVKWFSNTKKNVTDGAKNFGTNFKDGLISVKDRAIDGLKSWWTSMSKWFSQLGKKKEVKDSGKEMIKSVGDGFKNNKDDLMSKIGKVVLAIPVVILAVGGVIIASAGRELIKLMASGISKGADLVKTAVKGLWNGVKSVFDWGVKLVIDFFTSGFVGKMIKKVTSFSSDFGKKISDLWNNVKKYFTNGINTAYNYVKDSFVGKIITSIIEFAGSFKEKINEMWENVKKKFFDFIEMIYYRIKYSFIAKIISNIILFASDFRKNINILWDKVKVKFFEFIELIYNRVKNSFVGRIISSVIGFVKNFRENINNMWNRIKSIFITFVNSIYNTVKNSFIGRIISSIINFIKNFKTNISNMWNSLKSTFTRYITSIFNSIKNSFIGRIIASIIGFVRNFKTNISSMWTAIKGFFTNTISAIRRSIENSFVGAILRSGRNLKTNFINIVEDMWKGIKKWFNIIVDGAKALPGRIGRGIKSMAQHAVNGMKHVGNRLITWAKLPFNKVVGGINWVTGKLNKNRKAIPTWQPKLYAKGTGGHPGGSAILGDGVGSNAGEELTILPNGKAFMSPSTPTLYPDLPKGTEVLSATQTRDLIDSIPKYAKGTGLLGKIGGKAKDILGAGVDKVKGIAGSLWDFAKKPLSLVNNVLKTFGANMAGGFKKFGDFNQMMKGGFSKVKDAGVQRVKDTFEKMKNTDSNPNYVPAGSAGKGPTGPAGKGASRWRSTIQLASSRLKAGATKSEIDGIIAQIHRESGGNQKIVQSNAVWDVNTAAGNPARGLLQYIPQTFNAYKTRGHGNIYDGYHQLRAFFNNSTWRRDLPYGRRGWGPRGARRGYADGGIVSQKQLAWIAEGGWSESIISHDPSKKESQKAIWTKTGKALGFNNEVENTELLQKIVEVLENEKDTQLLERIAKAIEEGQIIEMSGEKVASVVHKPLKKKDAKFGVGRYF